MEIAIANEVQVQEKKYPTRPGITRMQPMLSCETDDGLSLRLIRSSYQDGDNAFETPRHHHAFQQIRFAEAGNLNYAPGRDIAAGDIAYFPKGTYYGPQRRDHGVGMTVQFGFGREMLGGKDALEVYRAGIEKLRSLGVVENGVFIDTDPETGEQRTRDTWQAVAEEITGEPFVIPEGRYDKPALMRAKAFDYFDVAPGVEVKHLGTFYDHQGRYADLGISMIRLAAGAVFRLEAARSQLIWANDAGLRIEGRSYPERTAAFSPRGEAVTLSADAEIEIHLIKFPRLD